MMIWRKKLRKFISTGGEGVANWDRLFFEWYHNLDRENRKNGWTDLEISCKFTCFNIPKSVYSKWNPALQIYMSLPSILQFQLKPNPLTLDGAGEGEILDYIPIYAIFMTKNEIFILSTKIETSDKFCILYFLQKSFFEPLFRKLLPVSNNFQPQFWNWIHWPLS